MFSGTRDSGARTATPTAVRDPRLVAFNRPLATALGLEPETLERPEGAAIFAGNLLPDGARPIAQAYAGHQFGHFTTLGDGRAILLGEQITPSGDRLDIQLKGAGQTRFSRRGDGRAALGPVLREYIVSEAMFALGIPTTRSLAAVVTGEQVFRDTAGVTGLIMTKLDGTARGGILVAAAEKFGLPIHAIGVGETADDLRPFDPARR